jgi:hypothetical protein
MTRRWLLFGVIAIPLFADDTEQVWQLFTQLASALSEGNAIEFMKGFDRAMVGYENLEANVTALLQQAQVQGSVELLRENGDDIARTVELDWFIEIVQQQDAGGSTRRRERISCRLVKRKKQWRIVSLQPLEFFTPPRPAR